jgi:hypothetical protein
MTWSTLLTTGLCRSPNSRSRSRQDSFALRDLDATDIRLDGSCPFKVIALFILVCKAPFPTLVEHNHPQIVFLRTVRRHHTIELHRPKPRHRPAKFSLRSKVIRSKIQAIKRHSRHIASRDKPFSLCLMACSRSPRHRYRQVFRTSSRHAPSESSLPHRDFLAVIDDAILALHGAHLSHRSGSEWRTVYRRGLTVTL